MKILALDLGKFNSVCCFFNTNTRKATFLTTPTKREHIADIFKKAKADLIVMESCGPSGWINDLALSMEIKTLVCSTNEEAWRWAKGVYERIYGKQKTRKKKAAIALARKIAVIAWAMLRDEKDWDGR